MVKKNKKYQAFSLVELMMAIFILSVIMLVSVSVFANVVWTRKNSLKVSNDLAAGREAIQIMAKNIRMGSRLDYISGNTKAIYFFSEVTGSCISYRFSGGVLSGSEVAPGGASNMECSTAFVTYHYSPMTRSDMQVDGSFVRTKTDTVSTPKIIGKATVAMLVDGKYNLQTTISFRNYEGII